MDASTAMTLSNVIISDKLLNGRRKTDFDFKVEKPLDEIMWKVITENPSWEFKVNEYYGNVKSETADSRPRIGVSKFKVFKDGEEIGQIDRDYRYDAGGHIFSITSNAIRSERERISAYRTKDAKKALAAIKKTFSNKSVGERVNEALGEAARVVSRQASRKRGDQQSVLNSLVPVMKAFAFVQHPEEFKKYAVISGHAHNLAKLREAEAEMLTVTDIEAKFKTDKGTSLVLLSNGKYVVKTGDEVQLYDDNTLPLDMRGKLGMLKLVEPEQMIEGVGCRATTEVFVLLSAVRELT
jgi:vacuolar-type H+-ATPase subunit F/Vma7